MHALKLSYTSSQEHGHSVRHAHKPPLNADGKMRTKHLHTHAHTHTYMHAHSKRLCNVICRDKLSALFRGCSTVRQHSMAGLQHGSIWLVKNSSWKKKKKIIKCVIFNADKHPNILAQLNSLVSKWGVWLCLGRRGCIYTIFYIGLESLSRMTWKLINWGFFQKIIIRNRKGTKIQ